MENISKVGIYDYDYADDVKMWEIVRYDKESEEWECMGVYCEKEHDAYALKNILNNKGV